MVKKIKCDVKNIKPVVAQRQIPVLGYWDGPASSLSENDILNDKKHYFTYNFRFNLRTVNMWFKIEKCNKNKVDYRVTAGMGSGVESPEYNDNCLKSRINGWAASQTGDSCRNMNEHIYKAWGQPK